MLFKVFILFVDEQDSANATINHKKMFLRFCSIKKGIPSLLFYDSYFKNLNGLERPSRPTQAVQRLPRSEPHGETPLGHLYQISSIPNYGRIYPYMVETAFKSTADYTVLYLSNGNGYLIYTHT